MNKKWYIKIYLKSGNIIYGYVINQLETTGEVAKMYFGKTENDVIGIYGREGFNLFYKCSEVEAFNISDEDFN